MSQTGRLRLKIQVKQHNIQRFGAQGFQSPCKAPFLCVQHYLIYGGALQGAPRTLCVPYCLSRVVLKIASYGRAAISLKMIQNIGLAVACDFYNYPAKTVNIERIPATRTSKRFGFCLERLTRRLGDTRRLSSAALSFSFFLKSLLLSLTLKQHISNKLCYFSYSLR